MADFREFTSKDFGYESFEDYERVLMQPRLVTFEVRKHRAKVKHALNRLNWTLKTKEHEEQLAISNPGFMALINEWIEHHRKQLAFCERRLAFLLEYSNGFTNEGGKPYVMKYQLEGEE